MHIPFFVMSLGVACFAYCGWHFCFRTQVFCDATANGWPPSLAKLYRRPAAFRVVRIAGVLSFRASLLLSLLVAWSVRNDSNSAN